MSHSTGNRNKFIKQMRKDMIPLDRDFPFSINDSSLPPGFDMGGTYHWHDCLEISYVKYGSGRYYVEDTIYEVGPGDVIVLNNVEPHYLEVDCEGMTQPVVTFEPSLVWSAPGSSIDYDYLGPFFERGTDFCNRIASNSPFTAEIRENLVFLEKEYSGKPEGYRLMVKARLLVILTYLIRHFRDCSKTSLGDKRKDLLRLEQALNYINMNFRDPIGLEVVAAKAYMTPQYFSAFFKRATGVNFIDYVNGLRVNHAVKLLRETNQKIIHIASECGFNNTANFNAIFKKVTGNTPSQFRNVSV